jgi:NAD(P)-dependent dehydrogenase (short-subunit alcohol dehydrogenase family)
LEEAQAALGEEGVEVVGSGIGDVRDEGAVRRVVAELVAGTGRLDAVIYAAGVLDGVGPLEEVAGSTGWADVETSLRGFANTACAVGEWLRAGQGSIVVLVGPGYNGPLAYAGWYAAGQAGLVRMVESLAREREWTEVGVYAVYPGVTLTPFMERLLSGEARRWLPQFGEAFAEGKEVSPSVATEMVAWLVRERPRVLSGRVIPALQTPEILERRLELYQQDQERGTLRLR